MSRLNNLRKSGGKRQLSTDMNVLFAPYFQPKAVYFTDGTSFVYLDRMKFDCGYVSRDMDGTMMVALRALEKIYSPDFTVTEQGTGFVLAYQGKDVTVTKGSDKAQCEDGTFSLELPVQKVDGEWAVPVENIMGQGFGKFVVWEGTYLTPQIFLGIGDGEEDLFQNPDIVKDMIIFQDKTIGVLRMAYYYNKVNKVCPYSLYVPTGYDPKVPSRLAMVLHGAMQGAADMRWVSQGGGRFQEAAEEHNTILLFVDGYAEGFYGAGTKPTMNRDECSPEVIKYLDLCEAEPFAALEEVKKHYNIDEKNIVLFGNSMGGCGTFYLGKRYPEIFKGIAPCGALISEDMSKIEMEGLRNKPVLVVCGTENIMFENLWKTVDDMKAKGVKAEACAVGGGVHGDAWIKAVPRIFDFFERECFS